MGLEFTEYDSVHCKNDQILIGYVKMPDQALLKFQNNQFQK